MNVKTKQRCTEIVMTVLLAIVCILPSTVYALGVSGTPRSTTERISNHQVPLPSVRSLSSAQQKTVSRPCQSGPTIGQTFLTASIVSGESCDCRTCIPSTEKEDMVELNNQRRQRLSGMTNSSLEILSPVVKPPMAKTASPHWKQLAPKFWQDSRGADARITWTIPSEYSTTQDETQSLLVAYRLLNELQEQQGAPISQFDELQQELASWMSGFEQYCQTFLAPTPPFNAERKLTARIVCTRGCASTKCPKWHQDHVPFRWIHSLVGPGCEWIEPFQPDAATLASVKHTNERIDEQLLGPSPTQRPFRKRPTPPSDCRTFQANEGEAVLLLGNKWKPATHATTQTHTKELPAVTHKSPDNIPSWQGRVLLTMNVVE